MPASTTTAILVAFDSRRGSVERLGAEVADGARAVLGTVVSVKRVEDVTRGDLLAADGVAVGSPVHTGTISTPVKRFFDAWHLEFDFYPSRPMQGRVGAAFAAGGQDAGGRELTLLTILGAFLHNGMVVVAGGGPYGASAATEVNATPLDARALAEARELGRRLAETATALKLGRARIERADR